MDATGFELLMAAKILGSGGVGAAMDTKGFERLMAAKILGKSDGGKNKELEGVPPLTFTANGQPLLDYRIYGNTENGESVGERTESGEPTGFKLPMTVSDGNTAHTVPVYIGKSQLVESEYVSFSEGKIYHKNPANYFDGYFELGAIDYNTGAEVSVYSALRTDFIELEPSNKFYFKWATGYFYIVPVSYDENKNYVRYLGAKSTNPSYFNLGANEKYIRFYLYNTTTPPKEMMVCKNANAPYYDPQDPPVPLPQIPTIKGETVIDYDGAPKPSQMYIKYKS